MEIYKLFLICLVLDTLHLELKSSSSLYILSLTVLLHTSCLPHSSHFIHISCNQQPHLLLNPKEDNKNTWQKKLASMFSFSFMAQKISGQKGQVSSPFSPQPAAAVHLLGHFTMHFKSSQTPGKKPSQALLQTQ